MTPRLTMLAAIAIALAAAGVARAGEPPPPDAKKGAAEAEAGKGSIVEKPEVEPRQWGRGPLEVHDADILATVHLAPRARSPEVLDPLVIEASLRGLWSNSWSFRPGRTELDAETRDLTAVVRAGLLPRLELGLEVNVAHYRGGGDLDGFIDGFHETFGLPDADREQRRRGKYRVTATDRQGRTGNLPRRGTGLGDSAVDLRLNLYEGSLVLPAVTLGARVRVPTAQRRFDHADGIDASFSVDVSKRIGESFVLYGGAAYTYLPDSRIEGFKYVRHRAMVWLGADLELGDHASIVAHLWYETPRDSRIWRAVPDLLAGNQLCYIAAGVKVSPVKNLTLELGGIENIIDPDVTADIGFYAAIGFRFG